MSKEVTSEEVLRKDERLSLLDWPELEPIDNITLGSDDCLVVGMGFENRALSVLELACNTSQDFNVVLIRYLPEIAHNREAESLNLCKEQELDYVEFVYDREHPSGIGALIVEHVSSFSRVFIDISGMSRLLIIQLIVGLIESGRKFHILYAEAEIYPPLEEEYEETNDPSPSFISSGIFEIVSSPELSSAFMLGGAIRLISFPSFDPQQLSNLVQEVQPAHNDVIHGIPPREEMIWRTAAIKQLNEATIKALQRVKDHEVSTLDYRETLQLIIDLYKEHSIFDRLLIAPTGSKMQAVAIGILRGVLADIQIIYPTPYQFVNLPDYTRGVRQVFHFFVDCTSI